MSMPIGAKHGQSQPEQERLTCAIVESDIEAQGGMLPDICYEFEGFSEVSFWFACGRKISRTSCAINW